MTSTGLRHVPLMATFGVLCLVLPATSPVARTHPELQWSTIKTPHFDLHFYEEERALAHEFALIAEEAYTELSRRFGFEPSERIQMVLVDDVDDSNGFAQVLPYNLITLYGHIPDVFSELGYTSDWRRILLYHELTHIFHLDNISGLPWLGNTIFGKHFVPNSAIPAFLVEGLAVLIESTIQVGGRIRSPLFDMSLRLAVVENGLFDIDEVAGTPLELPRGSTPYLYGSYFMSWLFDKYGMDPLLALIDEQGGKINPYSLNISFKRHYGETLVGLWREFANDTTAAFQQQADNIVAAGLVQGTDLGLASEALPVSTFRKDGTLIYYAANGTSTPSLWQWRPQTEPERVLRCFGGCDRPAELPDGSVVFASNQYYKTFYRHQDLMIAQPGAGHADRMTWGERTKDPSPSPDGRLIAFVTTVAGESTLRVGNPHDPEGDWTELVTTRESISWPAWLPDGTAVAASVRGNGGAAIWLFGIHGETPRQLTSGSGFDSQPVFTPDGKWLVYVSSRTGVHNLYARHLRSGSEQQLTNVLGGAFAPSVAPDGKSLVYASFNSKGYRLFSLDLELASNPEPQASAVAQAQHVSLPEPRPLPATTTLTLEPYAAWSHLAPRSWTTGFLTGNFGTSIINIGTTGSDPVGLLSYSLDTSFSTIDHDYSGSLSAVWSGWFPQISLYLGFYQSTYLARVTHEYTDYNESDVYASLALSFPVPDPNGSMNVSIGYTYEWFRGDVEYRGTYDPGSPQPFRPQEGNLASVYLDWSYDSTESYTYSVAPVRGTRLSASIKGAAPPLGSNWTEWHVRGKASQYIPMPWADNHSLLLHVAGGYSDGRDDFLKSFTIGGYPDQDILSDILAGSSSIGGTFLRGYPSFVAKGTTYGFSLISYNMPVLRIRRGIYTFPVFFRDISLEVFGNAGTAFDTFTWDQVYPGAGAELSLGLDLFYYKPFSLVIGSAYGFSSPGDLQFYFLLGN